MLFRMSCHQPFWFGSSPDAIRAGEPCRSRSRPRQLCAVAARERGYTLATTSAYLNGVREVVRCLQSRRIGDLTELTLQDLRAAHRRFLGRDPAARDAARALEQFLRAKGGGFGRSAAESVLHGE